MVLVCNDRIRLKNVIFQRKNNVVVKFIKINPENKITSEHFLCEKKAIVLISEVNCNKHLRFSFLDYNLKTNSVS